MKIFKFYRLGVFGRLGVKDDSFAPPSWKVSLWEKIKNNDLFQPINIHDENNIKEIRLFFNKKVFVVGINLFLITFIYSFCRDAYTVGSARYNLLYINKKNFNEELPKELLFNYKWKKFLLNSIKDLPDKKEKVKELKVQITTIENTIIFVNQDAKQKYFESNFSILKSNLIPLGNDLLIIYMILKYYWKRKKINLYN